MEDSSVIDVMLGAHIANRFDGDPVWLLMIAASSSAKTELLRSLDNHESTFFLSNLTPSTLVSGMKAKKGTSDPSLLPILNDKTLIMKDFTSVLSMRHENRTEILAQLREVFDGHYTKSFGTGKSFEWRGKVGMIAASTPAYDRFHTVISSMGDRFLLYRMQNSDSIQSGRAALNMVGFETEMREEIQKKVHSFIENVVEGVETFKPNFSESDISKILNVAAFSGIGRCAVERDGYDKSVLYQPLVEGPGRLVKQLYQMAMALMMIHDSDEMNPEIMSIIQKIGRDLLPVSRLMALQYLWDEMSWETTGTTKTTSEVAEAINLPSNTTKMMLEDLMVVGALVRSRIETMETAPYRWQITATMCNHITRGGVFGPPF